MNKQEFIAELSDKVNEVGEISQWHSGYKKGLYDTLVLARKLEEPEKPVIPQYVADWIEICKERADLVSCLEGSFQYGQGDFKTETIKEYEDWLFEYDHANLVARAWLDGYTVEKEKRYRLRLAAPILTRKRYLNKIPGGKRYFVGDSNDTKNFQTIFTEKELEDIDETGFEREEVEEAE